MAGVHRSGAAGSRVYELADGTEIRFDVTVAELEIMGEIVGGAVLFGEPYTQPLLGVTALESAGLEVDPVSRQLRKVAERSALSYRYPSTGLRNADSGDRFKCWGRLDSDRGSRRRRLTGSASRR